MIYNIFYFRYKSKLFYYCFIFFKNIKFNIFIHKLYISWFNIIKEYFIYKFILHYRLLIVLEVAITIFLKIYINIYIYLYINEKGYNILIYIC